MAKYRKKPVTIEAVQWNKEGDHPHVKKLNGMFQIKTLEGWLRVSVGDFIVTGVQGEQYLVESSIFEATYEKVGGQKK